MSDLEIQQRNLALKTDARHSGYTVQQLANSYEMDEDEVVRVLAEANIVVHDRRQVLPSTSQPEPETDAQIVASGRDPLVTRKADRSVSGKKPVTVTPLAPVASHGEANEEVVNAATAAAPVHTVPATDLVSVLASVPAGTRDVVLRMLPPFVDLLGSLSYPERRKVLETIATLEGVSL